MRKIFTLFTILFLAQATIGQTIGSLTPGVILCPSGPLSVTDLDVVTTATGAQLPMDYNLKFLINGVPFPIPGYPQTTNTSNWTIFSVEGTEYRVELLDVAGNIVDFMDVSIPGKTTFTYSSLVAPIYNDESCFGANDGSIEVWLQGGTPPYDFEWAFNGLPYTDDLDVFGASTLTGLVPGTYTATAVDDNGCAFDALVAPILANIGAATALDVTDITTSNFNGVNVSCFGDNDGTITVTPTGGTGAGTYSYSWDDPLNQQTPTAEFLAAGTYTCEVTDGNGCVEFTAPITLSQPLALDATITGTDISCLNGSDGTATVSVTAGTGTAPYTYLWSNGVAGTNISNLLPGTYTCTITDDNGCQLLKDIILTEPLTAVDITLTLNDYNGADVSCFGSNDGDATAVGSGGTVGPAGYSYEWTDAFGNTVSLSQNTGQILSSGTYTCEVTDDNGCQAQDDITLIDPPAIDFDPATTVSTSCNSANGNYLPDGSATVNVTVGTGTGSFTYLWDDPSSQTTQTATSLEAGIYTCQVTDANGCQLTTLPITVDEPVVMTATFGAFNHPSCLGDVDGSITATAVGGTPFAGPTYNYSWSNGTSNATATNLPSGPHTCVVTDANGCTDQFVFNLLDPPGGALAVTLTPTMVQCFGQATGSATADPVGGFPIQPLNTYTYEWKDVFGNIVSTSKNTGFILSAGTYTCTVTDDNGCSVTESTTVGQPNSPFVIDSITIDNVSCNGLTDGGAEVFASGGEPSTAPPFYTYQWTGPFPLGAVISTVSNISGEVAGDYILTITDNANCVLTQVVTITQPDPIIFDVPVTVVEPSCFGYADGTLTANPMGGTPPYVYSWDDPLSQTTQTANGLSVVNSPTGNGIYTCTVEDANGCNNGITNITAGQLTEPAQLVYNNAATPTIVVDVECFGDNSGSIELFISGGTQEVPPAAPYNYAWSNGATSSLNTGLIAGDYTCLVTDANNCPLPVPAITITQPLSALSATITGIVDETCFQFNNGQLDLDMTDPLSGANSGTEPYTFLWSNGETTQAIDNLPPSAYNCSITDANGCIIVTPFETITAATDLIVGTVTIPPTCNSTTIGPGSFSNGQAEVIITGGVGPFSYLWNDPLAQTTSTAIDLLAGTYNCQVIDANGCIANATANVGEPATDIIASPIVTDVTCFGDSTGQIIMSQIGGNPPITYFWPHSGETTNTVQNLTAGTYDCEISDATGCITLVPVVVGQGIELTGLITATPISVAGANDGSMFITAGGGTPFLGLNPYIYNWVDATGLTVGTTSSISALGPGTYTCTITDADGCSISETQVINAVACSVTVVDNISTIACYGDLATISWTNSGGLPPYTNTLTDPNGQIIDLVALYGTNQFSTNLTGFPPLTVGETGTYLLSVEDANGCYGNNAFNINLQVLGPDSITINTTTTDVACFGDSTGSALVIATGGTGALTQVFAVNGSGTPVNPNGLFAGTYSVTVTDSAGCAQEVQFTINEPDSALNLDTDATLVGCFPTSNGTATVLPSGGTPNYTYAWSTGPLSQTINNLVAGSYSCIVTDANGCTESAVVVVANAPNLDFFLVANDPSCNGSADGSITSTLISGTQPITYQWEDATNPGVSISPLVNLSSQDEGVYILNAVDAYGCSYSSYPGNQLVNPAPIVAIATPTHPSVNGACTGSIVVGSITGGTGIGTYTFDWLGPNGYTSSSAVTGDIFSLCAGTYQLTVTDASGCTDVVLVEIIDPACNVSVSYLLNQPDCNGDLADLNFTITGGITPYFTEIIDFATGLTVAAAFPLSSPQLLGPGNYYMVVTDFAGCVAQILDLPVVDPLPLSVGVIEDSVSCFGGSDGQATADVVGGTEPYVTYSWSNAPANNSEINPGLSANIPSTLTVTDANGCTGTHAYTIKEPDPLTIVSITTTAPSCVGAPDGQAIATVTGGTGAYTYLWSPSGESTNPAVNLQDGSQTLLVEDANACTTSDVFNVNDPAPLTATITATDVTCFNGTDGTITVNVSGGTPLVGTYFYLWSNGATTSAVSGLSAGSYDCTISDANGCTITVFATLLDGDEITSGLNIFPTSCFGIVDGSASVSPLVGGVPGLFDVLWWDLTTANLNSGIAPSIGTYWVQITDPTTGCYIIEEFHITEPNEIIVTSSADSADCNAQASGEITVVATGGSGTYDYYLYDDASALVGNNTTGMFSGLSAGIYTCDIDDGSCPLVVAAITETVFEPDPIVADSVIHPISCNGGNDGWITINPTGENNNFTIFWSVLGTADTFAVGLEGIDYTLTITPTDPLTGLPTGCPAYNEVFEMSDYEPSTIDLTNITLSFYDFDGDLVGTNIECFGNNDGEATINPSGGTGTTYSYLWNDPAIQTSQTATNLTAGSYDCIVSDINGCIASTTVTLTEPPLVETNLEVTHDQCFDGVFDGSATVTPDVVNSSPIYQVLWNGAVLPSQNSFFPVSAGIYEVALVNLETGCSSFIQSNDSTFEILDAYEILIDPTTHTNVTCFGGSDGTATVVNPHYVDLNGVLYSGTFTYLWDDALGQTTQTATGLLPGTYTCEVMDSNGCIVYASPVTITEPGTIVPNFTYVDVSCNGGNDGQVTVTPTGGNNASYTYSWSHNTSNTTNTDAGYQASTGLAHFVIITDAEGCSQQFNFDVTEPAPFVVSAIVTSNYGGEDISCYGLSDGEVTMTATGGNAIATYEIDGNVVTGNLQAGLPAGLYFVDATDVLGCTANTSVTITQPSQLIADSSWTNVSCTGADDGIYSVNPSGGTPFFPVPAYVVDWSVAGVDPAYHGNSTDPLYPLQPVVGTVTVTDANGCQVVSDVVITEPLSLPSSVGGIATSPDCNVIDNGPFAVSNNGTATVSPSGGTPGYTYLWDDPLAQTTAMATNLPAGTYTCTMLDANDCPFSEIVNVIAQDPLDAGLVTTPVSCLGFTDGSATVNPTGFQGMYSIQWSGQVSATTASVSGLSPGAFLQVIITDDSPFNCGTAQVSPVIIGTPISPLNATISLVTAPICPGDMNGQVQIAATGGVSPYLFSWDIIGYQTLTSNTLSPLLIGDEIVTGFVQDAGGCTTTVSFDMTNHYPDIIEPNIVSINEAIYNGFDIECNSTAVNYTPNGAIGTNATGGTVLATTSYTYSWTDDNGNSYGNSTSSAINGLSAGIYTVEVFDINGCSDTAVITLDEPSAISSTITGSDYNTYGVSCNALVANYAPDGEMTATVTGGAGGVDPASYSWANSANSVVNTVSTLNITGLPADVYTFTAGDINGCLFSTHYPLTQPIELTVTASSTATVCSDSNDGTAIANVNGGVPVFDYSWTGGQTTQTATGLIGNNTTYNVIVTDANGCEAYAATTITSPSAITVTAATNPTSCFGAADGEVYGMIATPAVAGGYEFSVNGGAFGPAFNVPVAGGPATIIAQNMAGCQSPVLTLTVNEPAEVDANLNVSTYPTCNGLFDGELISIPSGGNSTTYDFLWDDGTTSSGPAATLPNLGVGTHGVTVTDANGCYDFMTFDLLPATTLSIDFTSSDVSCLGASDGEATATLNSPGGGAPDTYQWNDPLGQTSPTATGLSAGTYICTITDVNGCEVSETVIVQEPNNPLTIDLDSTDLLCNGDNTGSASVITIQSGAGNLQYNWINQATGAAIGTTQTIDNLAAGVYEVTVNDANNCVEVLSIIVNEPMVLGVTLSSVDVDCFGNDNGSITTSVSGGTIDYEYIWTGSGNATGYGSTDANISNLLPGTYTCTITDANGCEITDQIDIIEPSVLSIAISAVDYNGYGVSCFDGDNGEVTINTSGGIAPYGVTYNLLPSVTPSGPDYLFTNLSAGVGIVVVTDANGCSLSDSWTITEPAELSIVSVDVEDPSCFGYNDGAALITATGGVPQSLPGLPPYSFVDISLNPIDVTALSAGMITIYVQDENNCMEMIEDLNIVEPLEIMITPEICLNSISIDVQNALGAYDILWVDMNSGALVGTDATVSGLDNGQYRVTIVDYPNGCTKMDSFDLALPEITVTDATCSNSSDGIIDIIIDGSSFYDISIDGSLVENDVVSATISNLNTGVYTIDIVDESNNCNYNTVVTVGYVGGYSCVDPPLIISPNDDGSNDTWIPGYDINVDMTVTIYNRWGQIEFNTEANSNTFEWDGRSNTGNDLPTADYYFVISFNDNTMADKTGVITLIR